MPALPITDPQLVRRLRMDDAQFLAYLQDLAASLGRREYTPAAYARALGYPWQRPARSYLLADGEVTLLERLGRPERERLLAVHTGPGADGRLPLLAFGSNGAPGALRLKFAHLGPRDREILVLAGALHDFDVGPSAHPTLYGALPATLFPSPGTAVRAAVLWVTPAQLVQLTWSEISYRLGWLEGARFVADEAAALDRPLLAFVSRLGTLAVDGAPVALAAVPATGRTAPALSQEQALAAAARLALGPEGAAEALVRRMLEDAGGFVRDVGPAIRAAGVPFRDPRFVPYPGPGDAVDAVAPGSAPG